MTGCGFSGSATAVEAPVALHGTVNGGQQPVSGSSIQLYAAGTRGPGSAAQPLLGDPVQSDSDGKFSIPATYRCPSPTAQLYVIARGGNPELSTSAGNPALELTAMLGPCRSLSASNSIMVNEVTTIGSIWPLAAFIKSSSNLGSAPGDASFLNAVASVPEFINIAQGSSPGKPTSTSYFTENSKLYSLSDLLANCVNSTGGSAGDGTPCGHLFSTATPAGGAAPTDTMTAALRIAQNPGNNVIEIFGLAKEANYFQPALTVAPNDWTLTLASFVAAPAISLATGSYTGPQEVTISDATAGSKIYYTTDGTVPTSSSPPYSGALSISVSSKLQAIAIAGESQSSVASSTLTITAAQPAARLTFLQQPSNALTGAPISPAVRVAVEDAGGNIVPSATNLVQVNLTGIFGLGGTLKVAARDGIAIFSNLTVPNAGSEYTLTATSPGLPSATSTIFAVSQPSTGSTTIRLALTPSSVTLTPSRTQTFTAAVAGTSNTAVTWSLSPAAGSISPDGLYTAPATVPYPAAVTITATSVADSTKSASAQVTITPTVGATYYLAPAPDGGRDSNTGLSPSAPWLSPNHAVNCGDVIKAAASTAYSNENFQTGKWGTVTCAAGNNVAWLECETFDACKITASNGDGGMWVSASNWGVQGWEVTTTASTEEACFQAAPPYGGSTSIHHIIFANDVANGCYGSAFAVYGNSTYSVDYVAIIGDIAYNAAQGNAKCFSGINIAAPIPHDTLSGTHFYIAGNLTWDNFEPHSCNGGTPTDGEGIILDTLDANSYTQQVVVDNNISFLNGSSGIRVDATTMAKVYILNNTTYGNDGDTNMYDGECGEITIQSSSNTEVYSNISRTITATGCGANPNYAFYLAGSDNTNHVYQDMGYSAAGYNNICSGTCTGFLLGPNNVFGTDPDFVSAPASNPGAPSCGTYSSVSACMAPIIADFVARAPGATGSGYQATRTTQVNDPLFPQWLCNANLPSGTVTMGCLTGPAVPAGVALH